MLPWRDRCENCGAEFNVNAGLGEWVLAYVSQQSGRYYCRQCVAAEPTW